MKSGPESELLQRYLDRADKAGRQLGFSGPNVQEWSESKNNNVDQRKLEEGILLSSGIKSGAIILCFDERGKDVSSEDFATILRQSLDNSISQIAFAIGGPDGHGESFRNSANKVLRFGKTTWPHQLARVMLAEQIYRAITILSGHPYHRV